MSKPPLLLMQELRDRINSKKEGRTSAGFSLDFDEKWILDTISSDIKRQTLSMTVREQSEQTYKREDGSNLITEGESSIATMYYKDYPDQNELRKWRNARIIQVYIWLRFLSETLLLSFIFQKIV